MKITILTRTILLLSIIIISIQNVNAQISLSFLNHYQVTPNAEDSNGVFCRIFHHSVKNKFYVVYAGRPTTSGTMQYFRWREYNSNFEYTGNHGTLTGAFSAGDFAMQMVGTYYYHIAPTNDWSLRLSKYDDDFNLINSTVLALDTCDSQADMMFDYTNNRLVIGVFRQPGYYHPSMPTQQATWLPRLHKWEYDLNLNPLSNDTVFNQIYTPWGASCLFNNDIYQIITCAKTTVMIDTVYKLNVYRYDATWNYINNINLNNDGQWSQGVLWDGNYYYVSYHSGHEHRSGNIVVAIYDVNWSKVYDTTITNNQPFIIGISPEIGTTQYNANRPFLLKVNDTLYVSYDVDNYTLNSYGPPHIYSEGNSWHANIMRFKILNSNSVKNVSFDLNEINIFPNPFNTQTTIQITPPLTNISLNIEDIGYSGHTDPPFRSY